MICPWRDFKIYGCCLCGGWMGLQRINYKMRRGVPCAEALRQHQGNDSAACSNVQYAKCVCMIGKGHPCAQQHSVGVYPHGHTVLRDRKLFTFKWLHPTQIVHLSSLNACRSFGLRRCRALPPQWFGPWSRAGKRRVCATRFCFAYPSCRRVRRPK